MERRAASPEGAVATESSQVLPKWTPAAGLSLTHDAALLRSGELDMLSRTRGDVLFAFGMFDWIELSANLPLVLQQKIATGGTSSTSAGIGDVRAGLKGTLLRLPRRGIGLGLMFDVTAPTGRASDHLGLGGPSYAPQLLVEIRGARAIRAAFNVGYLVRPDVRMLGRIAGDEVTMRGSVRLPLSWRHTVAFVAELDGRIALVRGAQNGFLGRIGFRGDTKSGVVIGAYAHGAPPIAFGPGQVGGTLSFAWAPPSRTGTERAFAGSKRPHAAAIALRHDGLVARADPKPAPTDPRDPDGDKVFASGDQCPSAAEDRDDFEDADGCPELDDDRDGIADAFDLCPRAPELVNGALDFDGCPDRRGKGDSVETLAALELSELAPKIAFTPGTDELTAASLASLARWVELARMNPWIERLELAVYVHPSGDPQADRAHAEARASAITTATRTAGIEDWRVRVRELGAVPAEVPERVRVAVVGVHGGLRPLAPEPAALQRWIAEASAPKPVEPAKPVEAAKPAAVPAGVDYAAQGPDAPAPKK